jgi:hypothetical protein
MDRSRDFRRRLVRTAVVLGAVGVTLAGTAPAEAQVERIVVKVAEARCFS